MWSDYNAVVKRTLNDFLSTTVFVVEVYYYRSSLGKVALSTTVLWDGCLVEKGGEMMMA